MIKKTQSSFFVFFRYYSIVLLILTVSIVLVYLTTIQSIEKYSNDINIATLEYTTHYIEEKFNEINNTILTLSLDHVLNEILSLSDLDRSSYSDVYYKNYLKGYNLSNDFIKMCIITIDSVDLAIVPGGGAYDGLSNFYGGVFRYDGVSYDEWRNQILGNVAGRKYIESRKVFLDGHTQNAVTIVQTLPTASLRAVKGAISVLVSEKDFFKNISNLYTQDQGGFCVLDREDNVIISNFLNKTEILDISSKLEGESGNIVHNINGEDFMISYKTSLKSGRKYVALLSKRVGIERVVDVRNTALSLILIAFSIGVIVCYYLALKSAKPINDMLRLLKSSGIKDGDTERISEYHELRKGIISLINDKKAYIDAIGEQTVLLRQALIDRLIRGDYLNPETIQQELKNGDIHIDGKQFTIILMQFADRLSAINEELAKQLSLRRWLVKKAIQNMIPVDGYSQDIQEDIIMLLICADSKSEDFGCLVDNIVDDIQETLEKDYNIKLNCAVGNIYSSIGDVYKSYREAMYVLDYVSAKSSTKHRWYFDIALSNSLFYYPIEMELRVINSAKAGNKNDLTLIFSEIENENFIKRDLMPDMKKKLFLSLQGTAVTLKGFPIAEGENTLDYLISLDMGNSRPNIHTFRMIESAFIELCDEINNKNGDDETQTLLKQIETFIEENYADPNFYRVTVSEQFGFSEANFSYFFKKHKGVTFSDFLESKRINRAVYLLSKGTMSVPEVAQMAGYNSERSFRRAFVRVKGANPSKFKQ